MKKFVVRKNKFGNFEINIKGKSWKTKADIWASMSVMFRKGIDPLSDKQEIFCKDEDWWFSVYEKKDGSTMPVIFVNGWYPNDDEKKEPSQEERFVETVVDVNSDDLPF